MSQIISQIAAELAVNPAQVAAAVKLLDEGSTVPFIARYRKEATNGLDDTQLRQLDQRLGYLRELADRKVVILRSIDEQGKLSDALRQAIESCDTKTELEDLYLPYKPKRRTKGQIAIEAGLLPLAEALLADHQADEQHLAAAYLNADAGFADVKAVLEGARAILMEQIAEDARLLGPLRDSLWRNATLCASVIDGQQDSGQKFRDYFDHQEPIHKVPSHRALAMLRGRNDGVLSLALRWPEDCSALPPEAMIAEHLAVNLTSCNAFIKQLVSWTWRVKLQLSLETDLLSRLREQAEDEAINVFAANLRDLFMAAPAGAKTTMGLDPGIRTGVKVAVVDATGKLLETTTVYPFEPYKKLNETITTLATLCQKHQVELISIGNGTASRETERLVVEMLQQYKQLTCQRVIVNEAGASIYSASELAAHEFPQLDVSLRGAVSIARRLQDPLPELVKIDPKSIGVGQYQHDVNQGKLTAKLDAVVEDCVNGVGVDLNMASAALLTRVAGLSKTLAENIVSYRESNGAFSSRKTLLKVPRLGPKAFEQAAGFLRIRHGDNPLDASAVHPEAYPVVERIAKQTQSELAALIGNGGVLRKLDAQQFTDEQFGLPTVRDILAELEKPGRDPRPEFRTVSYTEGVEDIRDLNTGMILEGVISNVTNFGAFVDIGVHQDGLVHISMLCDRFVSDPREVVKAGDIVKVKVIEVDVARKRIALSMRLDAQVSANVDNSTQSAPRKAAPSKNKTPAISNNAFADAFAKAKRK